MNEKTESCASCFFSIQWKVLVSKELRYIPITKVEKPKLTSYRSLVQKLEELFKNLIFFNVWFVITRSQAVA